MVLNIFEDEENKLIGIEAEYEFPAGKKLLGKKSEDEEPAFSLILSNMEHRIIGCSWDENAPQYTNFEFIFGNEK